MNILQYLNCIKNQQLNILNYKCCKLFQWKLITRNKISKEALKYLINIKEEEIKITTRCHIIKVQRVLFNLIFLIKRQPKKT